MDNAIEIKGQVEKILPLQEFPSGFTKRVLVVKTEGNYPQMIPIEFVKDKTARLDGLIVGQSVTVSCNIRGSEYNGKYFAGFTGFKISKGEAPMSNHNQDKSNSYQPQTDSDEDDIPF